MKTFRILTAIGTVAILVGATGCSPSDHQEERNAALPLKLCKTEISTAPIKKLYPGPYNEVFYSGSDHDSLNSLKKGRKHGECSVILAYINRSEVEKTTHVNVVARVSNDSTAEELVALSIKVGMVQARNTVHAGKITGVSGAEGSAVAFPCTERTDQAQSIEVTFGFTPDEMDITESRRSLITNTSATYAVHIARYLNDKFLKCLDPAELSGPINTKIQEVHHL